MDGAEGPFPQTYPGKCPTDEERVEKARVTEVWSGVLVSRRFLSETKLTRGDGTQTEFVVETNWFVLPTTLSFFQKYRTIRGTGSRRVTGHTIGSS